MSKTLHFVSRVDKVGVLGVITLQLDNNWNDIFEQFILKLRFSCYLELFTT